jgi:hypothetical protein
LINLSQRSKTHPQITQISQIFEKNIEVFVDIKRALHWGLSFYPQMAQIFADKPFYFLAREFLSLATFLRRV